MKLLAVLFLSSVSFSAHAIPSAAGLKTPDGTLFAQNSTKDRELVVFWATWCGECRTKLKTELPEIDKRTDVSVLAVSVDEDPGRVRHFLKREKLAIPVAWDGDKKLRKELNITAVPAWAVYKRSGDDWKLVDTALAFDSDRVNRALAVP